MRLRPRASSSDLDEARSIAERLEGPPKPTPTQSPTPPSYVRFGVGAPPLVTPAASAPRATPPTDAPARAIPPAEVLEAAPPISTPETPIVEATEAVPEAGATEALIEASPPPAEWPVSTAADALVEEPAAAVPEAEETPAAEPAVPPTAWPEAVTTDSLVEEPVPAAAPFPEAIPDVEAPSALQEWPEGAAAESLVEVPPEEPAAPEASGLEGLVGEAVPEEEPPAPPPSWESLLARARELAAAQAAMVIGPEGSLLSATDGWPAVGAAAIAAKLLPVVSPRLTSPDAFVPVKLSGHVLSVWRVAVAGGAVTVATLATQALPSEVRPEIDGLVAQGSLDAPR
jgi:hypothetical protein